MRNVFLVALNTLKVTFRKKGNIIVFLVIPVLSILISTALYSGSGSRNIRIGINDNENSTLSKDIGEMLKKNDKFNVENIAQKDMNEKIVSGKLDCVVIIPNNFSESIYNGSFKELEIVSIKGEDTTIWIKNSLEQNISNMLDISKASKDSKEVFHKIYDNYKEGTVELKVNKLEDNFMNKSVTLQSLGFLVMFMMLGATTTSNLILKEKRDRTYYRILSSPVQSKNYVMGNIIANLIIMTVQTSIVVFAVTRIFKVKTYIPSLMLIFILLCFGIVAIGLGILIVSFSKTTAQAGYLGTLIITPTCMLGGCFWDVSLMPASIQKVANFMPQKWTLHAINKIQTGGSFADIWMNILIILCFAAAFFLIGIYKLKSNDNVKNFI